MKTPITQQAAHLAELCHGQTPEAVTDFITGFLRVIHAEHARKVKLLRSALTETVRLFATARHTISGSAGDEMFAAVIAALKDTR